MKLRVPATQKVMLKVTGDEPKPKSPLTYDQINQWSDYAESNPGANFDALWSGFTAKNPKSGIDRDILKADLAKLVNSNRALGGQVGHWDSKNLHTGFSFPKMVIEGKDYGRVNADLKTQISNNPPQSSGVNRVKVIPPEAAEIWQDPKDNEIKFIDPKSGDVVYADRTTINDPRVRASLQKQKTDMLARSNASTTLNKILSGQ